MVPAPAKKKPSKRSVRAPKPSSGNMFERFRAEIRKVPRGKVATYGEIARAAGFPGAARQVSWALAGSNPSHQLPWHRILGAGGRLLMPGEYGLEQRMRLEMENVIIVERRVIMKAYAH